MLEIVALLKLAVAINKGGDFELSVFAHALESGIFAKGVLNLKINFVDLDLEVIDFSSEITDSFLVDVHLNLVFVFSAFLLIEEESVLGLNVSDFIVQPEEVMFEVLQFEKLLLEGGDNGVLVLGLSLVKQAGGSEVSVHLPDGN